MLHASDTQKFFRTTYANAKRLGMRINTKKTQMMCMNVAKHSIINPYINTQNGQQIEGQDRIKMLGFVFGRRPNASEQLKHESFTRSYG